MKKSPYKVHPDFKLNGTHFNAKELYSVAYSYIKEGNEFEEQVGNFLLDWFNEDYDTIKLRTSGSTGTPKVYYTEKEKMIASALASDKFFKLKNKTKALMCMPANYIAGRMMLVRALTLGWDLRIIQPTTHPLDSIFEEFDFCAMTPLQLSYSFERLHFVKKIIVGGGTVSHSLIQLIQGLPTKIYEVYGMTETISHVAARRLNPKSGLKSKNGELLKPFKAMPKINFSTDQRGCLTISSNRILDETLITNDLVELINPQEFYWKGRIDNVVNTGGVKVFPETIEKKLESLITDSFFVSSLPDEKLGERLILVVQEKHSEEYLSDLKSIVKSCEALDKFEVPKEIYLIDKFIYTPTGKINRQLTLTELTSKLA